jgi:hypothetical protein
MRSWFFAGFLAVTAASSAFAGTITPTVGRCQNDPDCVPAGNDYFVTQPGTFFTIAGVTVPLTGIPDPSNYGADTIVQRLANIDIPNVIGDTETVATQMLELNLTGVDPNCPQGVGACDVYVSLDPINPSTGQLVFTQTVGGEATVDPSCSTGTATGLPCEGTFTSFFDVFVDLSFTTLGGAPLPCDANGDITGPNCVFGGAGSPTPLVLTGSGSWTDDNGALFIVGGQVSEVEATPPGVHDAMQINPTPEPGTLILLGTGLSLFALSRRRQIRG